MAFFIMINNINNFLKSTYKISGYIAAIFLVLVAVFILTGISSRIFGFYIRGLAEYSGYSMAASSFFALAYTFNEKAHIRITLFIEKIEKKKKRFSEIWCLSVASFFSGFMAFYFIKMVLISIQFEERSEGADEIFIWIPQASLAIGSFVFFICVFHHLIFSILNKKIN
jgi:TRAP-type C4-dicarboxylate transport system permease small subunit